MPPTYSAVLRAGHVEHAVGAVAGVLVTDGHHAAGRDLQRPERRVAVGHAGGEVVAPHLLELLRVEEDRQPAVGVAGGRPATLWPIRLAQNTGMSARFGWLISFSGLPSPVPWPGRQRDLHGRAVVDDRLAPPRPSGTTSMYSRMRGIGCSYGTPWKPSMTCGPDAPRPRTNRPSLTKSQPAAVWAIAVAVRENTLMIPVPISIARVLAAR